jgi:hypothetical protein
MARKAAVVITTTDSTCGCGCGAETAKGRRYKQGHDAKLRGILARAARAGQPVRVNGETKPAAEWLEGHGWPAPVRDAPKPRATKQAEAVNAPAA